MEGAIKKAIKLALKGGWQPKEPDIYWKGGIKTDIPAEVMLLDPDWWKCLGKELGWYPKEIELGQKFDMEEWLKIQHRFIDWMAEEKDVDEFFSQLLNKN